MISKKLFKAVVFLLLLCSFQHVFSERYYVIPSGSGAGNSWSNAMGDLQAAIDGATAGDEVWVKTGTYIPHSTDRTISFTLKSGVKVYGGFKGDETALNDRALIDTDGNGRIEHWEFQYPTILSGEIQEDADETNNSQHVVTIPNGLDASTLLNGFNIIKGYTDVTTSTNDGPNVCGSGILVLSGKVQACYINECKAVYDGSSVTAGAGVFALGAKIEKTKIDDCHASNESGSGRVFGGGLYSNSNCVVDSCIIKSCTVTAAGSREAQGGGAYFMVSNMLNSHIMNCSANGSTGYGGGIYSYNNSTIVNTIVNNCTAGYQGGGMYIGGYGFVSNCVIAKCSVTGTAAIGGGAYSVTEPKFYNTVFWGNYTSGSSVHLRLSTDGTAYHCAAEDETLSGNDNISISSNNTGSETGELYARFKSPTNFVGVTGGDAVNENELLLSDWNIEVTSDLIEKGDNNGFSEAMHGDLNGDGDKNESIDNFTDPMGENRLFNYNADIGAFEVVFIDLVLPNSVEIEYGKELGDINLTGGSATDNRDDSDIEGSFAFTDASHKPPYTGEAEKFRIAFTPVDNVSYPVHYDSLEVTVTKKVLTLSGLSATDKEYDGTTDVVFSGTATLVGKVGSDDVNLNTGAIDAAYEDKNVGNNKAVNFNGYELSGADKDNYILSLAGTYADITPKPISLSNINALDKEYDGTTVAKYSGSPSLAGIISGDDVTIDITAARGEFADKNVGTGITVTYAGFALVGVDKDNYLVDTAPLSTADITPMTVTVSGLGIEDKVYDGNTDAALTGTAEIPELVAGDNVTLDTSGAIATFDTKHVGNNKVITFSGYTLTGTDVSNYSLVQPASAVGSINSKELTVTNISVNSKVYDGTTQAALSGTPTLNGVISGEDVSLDITGISASFSDFNAGSDKEVLVTGMSLQGTETSNYNLATTQILGTITPVEISIEADAASKVYNQADPTFTYTITSGSLVGSDTFSGSLARVSGEDARTYQIVIGSLTLGSNYTIDFTENTFTINQAPNEITFTLNSPIKYVKDLTVDLTATASSGLTVAFESSDESVASVTGSLLKINSYGIITITAKEDANVNYEAATPVVVDLTIIPEIEIVHKGSNMLLIDNTEGLFYNSANDQSGGYQWYNDGIMINGATKQFYYNTSGLSGEYYCEVTTISGDKFTSDVYNVSSTKSISIYPSPVKAGESFNVKLAGFDDQNLNETIVQIYSITGTLVKEIVNPTDVNNIRVEKPGVYVIKTDGDSRLSKKIIIKD